MRGTVSATSIRLRRQPGHPLAWSVVLLCILIQTVPGQQKNAGPAAAVTDVSVTGASTFTPREILSWMTLRAGSPFSPAALRSDLLSAKEHFRADGYLNAHVTAAESYNADSTTVHLTIEVEQGRRTVLGSLRVAGNISVPSSDLLSLLDSRIGAPLDQQMLESDVAAVLGRYEKLGYPMTGVVADSFEVIGGPVVDSLTLTLVVDEGPRVAINEVRVQGNSETSTNVIVRESRVRMGEYYDPDHMQTVRQRLLRLNIFSSVSEPELYLHGTTAGILIRVQEGRTNTFDGIAGYMPGTGTSDGYFTGLVSVSMRNLFGTARKLQFRWEKEDRHSQDLLLGYSEPWLLGMPVNIGLDFQQRRQDTSYVRQGGNLRIEWMFSEELTAGVIGSAASVFPSADTAAARVPRSSTTSAGVDVVYDSRDDLFSPTGGARYRADYHYGRKSVRAGSLSSGLSGSIQRITLDLDSYLKVFERQIVALGMHGRQVQGAIVDESEFYRFGGTNTLRGYRENQFAGTKVGWINAEYRLLLARRSFVYAFTDVGYYSRPGSDLLGTVAGEAFLYGYGFGLRFESPLGNLGVSFALGKGDSFAQGKVHFGLLNEF
jgi:outer membrane protein assembly factor BamA